MARREVSLSPTPTTTLRVASSQSDQTVNNPSVKPNRPTQEEAEQAVRVLLGWAGDNPAREGLHDTPSRVVRAFEEYFAGYKEDPVEILNRTFDEVEGYDEMVLLRDIRFESHCEHHLAPFIGQAHVAYLPENRVVGISKLARVVDIFARRLQIQEKMTAQIANAIEQALQPRGVAVMVQGSHGCMTCRGVHKSGASMVTTKLSGQFKTDPALRDTFLAMVTNPSNFSATL